MDCLPAPNEGHALGTEIIKSQVAYLASCIIQQWVVYLAMSITDLHITDAIQNCNISCVMMGTDRARGLMITP